MKKYGVTETGINKMHYDEIVEEINGDIKAEISNFNTRDDNPLVLLIKQFGVHTARLWDFGEDAYNSKFISTAKGVALDLSGKIKGLKRKKSTYSVGKVKFTGDLGVVIPPNFQVGTNGGLKYLTTNKLDVVIDATRSVEIEIQAIEGGKKYNVDALLIDKIVNPITGLESVINESKIEGGSDLESPAAFRKRLNEFGGNASLRSIVSNVLKTNVTDAFGLENVEDDVDDDGLPPHSFEIIVVGGTDEEIVTAIEEKKSAGINMHGSVSVDYLGNTYKFTRADVSDIHVQLTLGVNNDRYLNEYTDLIKNNYINYIERLSVGDVVTYNEMLSQIYIGTQGVVSSVCKFGTNPLELTEQDIKIGIRSIPSLLLENITINLQ